MGCAKCLSEGRIRFRRRSKLGLVYGPGRGIALFKPKRRTERVPAGAASPGVEVISASGSPIDRGSSHCSRRRRQEKRKSCLAKAFRPFGGWHRGKSTAPTLITDSAASGPVRPVGFWVVKGNRQRCVLEHVGYVSYAVGSQYTELSLVGCQPGWKLVFEPHSGHATAGDQ